MDVDQPLQVQLPYGSGQDGQDRLDAIIGMGGYGMLEGDGFDTVQAGFLQQQVSCR